MGRAGNGPEYRLRPGGNTDLEVRSWWSNILEEALPPGTVLPSQELAITPSTKQEGRHMCWHLKQPSTGKEQPLGPCSGIRRVTPSCGEESGQTLTRPLYFGDC